VEKVLVNHIAYFRREGKERKHRGWRCRDELGVGTLHCCTQCQFCKCKLQGGLEGFESPTGGTSCRIMEWNLLAT